ncbi:MAG: peptidoglycan DD-metalloendopeptidase family protein [Thiohalophilus sp.]|uniref:peptidoglycan DD-metalloendopeptidase family protein n=1 Tax=Thiohalophilus sp. TaxID=3028392 RepID=UPI00287081A3|nr:peptidoglycan DD-metalloendopeptidase family protein [Thiohalophilus sp.]MDR9437661.1 peptidoglycan DD-metalloendopeptidase family protein [Thiohalophilus sp.]
MKPGVIGIIMVVVALAGCRPFVHYDPDRERGGKGAEYTVSKGDTLYSIAWQHGHDYRTVARWNGISAPYTIYPGQKIHMYPGRTAAVQSAENTDEAPASPRRTARSTPSPEPPDDNRTLAWEWPVDGEIVNTFSGSDPGKKGLDIAGRMGQSVKAAADGKVVYSGNGLRGYGNLIIIKHNTTYFSAYAYNSKLHVQENDTVTSGQHIADMGNNGSGPAMLHFEIRRNGTPQDPVKYLPKKGS